MAIQSGYSNPIALLRYILTCQNWGDNETGEPSATALIRTGVGVNGSFDSATLDPVRNVSIRYMIDEEDKGATKDLVDKICKQFSLIQYTDTSGYECVKYLFAETSDSAIPQFVIDETTVIDAYQAPDQAKLCVNPIIDYDYDYGLEKFTKTLEITNVQSTGIYSPLFSYGFEGTDGETYWNMCRNQLWPQSRHVEEMDSGWRENEFIYTYAGALLRLTNVIKMMKAATLDFTVPFAEGVLVSAGDIISLTFPHLQYTGQIVYNAVVTGVSKSFSGNNVNIECMFIGENIPFGLMDTTDGENWPLINSYDPQPLQLTDGFNENGNPSDLTYIDPAARWTHITQINDNLTTLISEMDNCQIGIDTDNDDFTFKNDTGVLYVGAKQRHWSGTDWIYDDANFANINLHALTGGRALYLDANRRIQSSPVTNIELGYLSGKNSVIDGSGAVNYFPIFTGANRLGNSIMTGSAAGIEINSVDYNYNGGVRVVADESHVAGIFLGCAAGGYGTQNGQWSIYRDVASVGSSLTIRHGAQNLFVMNTTGSVTIGQLQREGGGSAPRYLSLGATYSVNPISSFCKLFLYDDSVNRAGLSIGNSADVQYHSSWSTGRHDFYTADALRVRITTSGDLLLGVSDASGGTVTPRYIDLGLTYSDNSPVSWLKSKIFLHRTANDGFAFGIGNAADLQYHSGGVSAGRHDFYSANTLIFTITNTVVGTFTRQTISHSPYDTQYGTSNLELISNGIAFPTRYPSIGFHRSGVDAMTLLYAGGRTLQVRDHVNATLDTIWTTGNLVGHQTAHYHNTLHAIGFEGTYYVRCDWTPVNGDYKWRLTSNYADPEVSVGHSDYSINSGLFQTNGITTFLNTSLVTASNYNDGLRIGRSAAGYSLIALGCSGSGWTGTQTGQWTIYSDLAAQGYRLVFDYASATRMILTGAGALSLNGANVITAGTLTNNYMTYYYNGTINNSKFFLEGSDTIFTDRLFRRSGGSSYLVWDQLGLSFDGVGTATNRLLYASKGSSSQVYFFDSGLEQGTGQVICVQNFCVQGQMYSENGCYYGPPTTEGSWRTMISGTSLVHQRREAGVWVTKATITA